MGILSDLFGIANNQQQVPVLTSIVPANAAQVIRTGQLPQFSTKTIMLGKNEICRFIDRAVLITQKTQKEYRRRSNGSSFRVAKGFTIHSGGGTTTPIEHVVTEYTQGFIYVTDIRIIFVAQEKTFEKKVKNLTAVVPYNDAVGLQYGSQTFNLIVPQSDLMVAVLHIIYHK